jgi:hypothetical protein
VWVSLEPTFPSNVSHPSSGLKESAAWENGTVVFTANVVPSPLILALLVFLRSVLQLLVTANVVPSPLILPLLVFLRCVLQLLVTANVVPSSLILSI